MSSYSSMISLPSSRMPIYGIAGLALRSLANRLEDLLKPLHLLLGLAFVLSEGGFEVLRLCRLCHLGQRGQNFLLGEVDVLQRVPEEVLKCFVFGHVLSSL